MGLLQSQRGGLEPTTPNCSGLRDAWCQRKAKSMSEEINIPAIAKELVGTPELKLGDFVFTTPKVTVEAQGRKVEQAFELRLSGDCFLLVPAMEALVEFFARGPYSSLVRVSYQKTDKEIENR